MQLLFPAGLALLALIPVLILIHSLKPKPRQVDTTTLFVWQEILDESGSGARLRQLKNNLPLLLQILIVLIASLALARPVWTYPSQQHGNTILVIDTSASMKTETGNGSRFELARKRAEALIGGMADTDRMMVIAAGYRPAIISDYTSNAGKLSKAVDQLQSTDMPGRPEKALYLALSFLNRKADGRIFFITDGAGPDFNNLLSIHPDIRPILVEGGDRNIGITRFAFREVPDRKGQFEIMLEIRNDSLFPSLCPIRITVDDRLITNDTIGLKKGETRAVFFNYHGLLAGTAQARLLIDDDFSVDNRADIVLNASKDIWIQLISKGNFYLQKLLAVYPNFQVNRTEEIVESSWKDQTANNDIVILDRTPAPAVETGNLLLIDSLSPSLPLKKTGQIRFPQVMDWDRTHPILANLDLSGLVIESAAIVSPTQPIKPLVRSSQTGLIYAIEGKGFRAVYIGFDLTRSNLPLKVAFPVLMGNIFQWLRPEGIRFKPEQTRAGQPVSLSLTDATEPLTIRWPSGKRSTYRPQSTLFEFNQTDETGIYRVDQGKSKRYFAVNLLDANESDIRPANNLPIARPSAGKSAAKAIEVQFDLWVFLVFAGLLLLLLEWRLILKRKPE